MSMAQIVLLIIGVILFVAGVEPTVQGRGRAGG